MGRRNGMSEEKPKVVNKVIFDSGKGVYEVGTIETRNLKISEHNIRKLRIDEDLEALEESILEIGQREPILLDENYEVLRGQRRVIVMQENDIPTALYIKIDYTGRTGFPDLGMNLPAEAYKVLDSLLDTDHQMEILEDEKGNAIAKLRKLGFTSDAKVAKVLGRAESTVRSWRLSIETPPQLDPQLLTYYNKRFKLSPASKKDRVKKSVDTLLLDEKIPLEDRVNILTKVTEQVVKTGKLEELAKQSRYGHTPKDLQDLAVKSKVQIFLFLDKVLWYKAIAEAKRRDIDRAMMVEQGLRQWLTKRS